MNIISKIKYVIIILMLFVIKSISFANDLNTIDSTFDIAVELNIGYTTAIDSNISNLANWGISPTMRIMWEPNRKLRIGAETSYLNVTNTRQDSVVTEFGITNFKSKVKALPIILVFNMKIWHVDVYAGTGAALLISTIESFGNKEDFFDWDNSFMFAAAYHYTFSNWFKLGAEFSTYYFSQVNTFAGGFNLSFKFIVYEW